MAGLGNEVFSQQIICNQAELLLVGIKARTNNADEASGHGKIGQTITRFWADNLSEQINHRVTPALTFSVYTDYETDANGNYTYFYGQQVNSIDRIPDGLFALTIPAQKYRRFTTSKGPMPKIVINAWNAIWQMTSEQLGGQRSFKADFEVYGEESTDPTNASVELFIGID